MSLRSTRYSVFLLEGKSRYLIRLLQDFLMLKLTTPRLTSSPFKSFNTVKTKVTLLWLAVLLGACGKKDDDQSLIITAVEYGTNKPIPNVGIMVYDYESYKDRWGGYDVYYDSVVTNSQGKAFLDGSKNEPVEIRLFSQDKNYYDQWPGGANGEFYIPEVKRNGNKVELIPFAWAKIRFIKESKNIDYIRVGNLSGEIYGYLIHTKDTVVGGQTLGNKPEIMHIYPYKDGQALGVNHDTILSKAHDTTYHEIKW